MRNQCPCARSKHWEVQELALGLGFAHFQVKVTKQGDFPQKVKGSAPSTVLCLPPTIHGESPLAESLKGANYR